MIGPHFGIIPRWAAGLGLTGAEHRVLLAVACHARKETRIARLSIQQIANEVKFDRRNIQRAIRRLEARGVIKQMRGGGRARGSHLGRASEYQIIFTRPTDAINGLDDAAAFDADDTGNSDDYAAISGQETAASSELNSVAYAAPTESEQKEKNTPPSGEARRCAREEAEDFGISEKQEVQPLTKGGGDPMALLRSYNPSAGLVDWASEQYGINALDDAVLGAFIDWHVEHDRLPGNSKIEGWRRRTAGGSGASGSLASSPDGNATRRVKSSPKPRSTPSGECKRS